MEELERKFDEASESDSVSVDTNTSERYVSDNIAHINHKTLIRIFRSTLRPHNHEMDRSSNSTGI